jgi:hypothetical protein
MLEKVKLTPSERQPVVPSEVLEVLDVERRKWHAVSNAACSHPHVVDRPGATPSLRASVQRAPRRRHDVIDGSVTTCRRQAVRSANRRAPQLRLKVQEVSSPTVTKVIANDWPVSRASIEPGKRRRKIADATSVSRTT